MKIQLLGAAQTVTGSCYLIEANGHTFTVDCGMYQGNAEIEKRNWDSATYKAKKLDFILLTHAHIDHSGLLPRLVRDGFGGRVYGTLPTRELARLMLLDSAHIQETEAAWNNRRSAREGKRPTEALYSVEDAEKAGGLFEVREYGKSFEPAPGIKVTFQDAGHILGSAFTEIEVTEADGVTKLLFSGDLGRPEALLLDDPDRPDIRPDYVFLESTYGDRDHKDESTSRDELAAAIRYSYDRGQKTIIPAFAVERTQEILYCLYLLHKAGKLPRDIPVFVDSPLAIRATEVFKSNPEFMDKELADIFRAGGDPFFVPNLKYTLDTKESQAINTLDGPAIVISASGMCNAGRIKHHLRHNLWRTGASIVFVGYQAIGTPGRKIVDGAKSVTIHGEDIKVEAKIFTIGGFSAHAGQSQLLAWVKNFARPDVKFILVHGEDKAQSILAEKIKELYKASVEIPGYLDVLTLVPGEAAISQPPPEQVWQPPRVNWEFLFKEAHFKVDLLRQQTEALAQMRWEDQVELRDKILHINSRLSELYSSL